MAEMQEELASANPLPMATPPRTVRFGLHDVEFGEGCFLQPLIPKGQHVRDGDWETLRKALAEDGYAYLDGALPREDVLAARSYLLNLFSDRGDILEAGRPPTDGVLQENCGVNCVPFMEGKNDWTHNSTVLKVLESDNLKRLFAGLFGEEPLTFDFKWLRAVPNGSFTGAHYDAVYMSRGTPHLVTCWIPFDDIVLDLGALAMCDGSHTGSGFQKLRDTYGKLDHEADRLDGTGWFSLDPKEVTELFGGQWRSTDYRAGDAMIFGMHTMHMSTTNTTNRVRMSCDVRWQPQAESADPRYVGDVQEYVNKMERSGAYKASSDGVETAKISIRELRDKWGFPVAADAKLR